MTTWYRSMHFLNSNGKLHGSTAQIRANIAPEVLAQTTANSLSAMNVHANTQTTSYTMAPSHTVMSQEDHLLLCSVIRAVSTFMQMMVICMSDTALRSNIFQSLFAYSTKINPGIMVQNVLSYNSCLPLMIFREY